MSRLWKHFDNCENLFHDWRKRGQREVFGQIRIFNDFQAITTAIFSQSGHFVGFSFPLSWCIPFSRLPVIIPKKIFFIWHLGVLFIKSSRRFEAVSPFRDVAVLSGATFCVHRRSFIVSPFPREATQGHQIILVL